MVHVRDYDRLTDQVMIIYDRMFQLYIVKGAQKNFLIDSGSITKARDFSLAIDRVLNETGSKVKGIQTLLLTHTHWDHTGSASFLQQKYGFDVFTSPRGLELLQKDKVIEYINRLNQDHKQLIDDTSDTVVEKLQNLSAVNNGDRIPVDEHSYFEAIEAPGHTKCSMAYYLYPAKVLFSGDTVGIIEQTGIIRPLYLSSYTDYENSFHKLMALDVDILALPHNRPIRGKERVKRHLEQSLQRTHEIRDKIIRLLNQGESISGVAEILYRTEFSRPTLMGPREALMTNLEAMVNSVQKECM
ncbi:MAG: MBL fold metallo-hydrolase [Candidatus Omnitrophota bacterium]